LEFKSLTAQFQTMIKLVVLGSSAAVPSVERSLAAIGLRYEGDVYLFDCGEGTQRQMMKYGLSYAKVKCIFVTHSHADHIVGIAGLAQTLGLIERKEPLYIYCPTGCGRHIEALLSIGRYPYEIIVREIGDGICHKGDGFSVSAFPVQHAGACLGYVFAQEGRRNFNEAKCRKLGIRGRMFGELERNGEISVGGKKIAYAAVSKLKPGIKVAYSGDGVPGEATVAAAKGADVLIHEATYANEHEKEAALHSHSTAAQAAAVAKKAGVKRLVLTHVSGRYTETKALQDEARKIFKKSDVAKDGMEILISE
jgi:ribonuclease Z